MTITEKFIHWWIRQDYQPQDEQEEQHLSRLSRQLTRDGVDIYNEQDVEKRLSLIMRLEFRYELEEGEE